MMLTCKAFLSCLILCHYYFYLPDLKKATYSPNVGKYCLLLFLFELDHQ